MTDQAPELLPQVCLPRWWLEQLRDQLLAMKKLPTGYVGDWVFMFREQLNDALESRPTPSEPVAQTDAEKLRNLADVFNADIEKMERPKRPISQVREALALKPIKGLINEVYGVWDAFEYGLRHEISNTNYAVVREKLAEAELALAALTAERPSESAVAWRFEERGLISQEWLERLTFDQPEASKRVRNVEPLYVIPHREAVAWTEEERHAIAHARHQVEQASPEKPDCCFDFDLVKDLLRVIDRSTPHGDAVRAQTIEECAKISYGEGQAGYISCDPTFERAYKQACDDIAKKLRALSPTLASERVSERTGEQ